jgi:hypothetical protein
MGRVFDLCVYASLIAMELLSKMALCCVGNKTGQDDLNYEGHNDDEKG